MKEFVESLSNTQLEQMLKMFDCGSSPEAMSTLSELLDVLESIAESRGIDTDTAN